MPCITLLSDLGLKDPTVAIAKGILMQHVGTVPITDLTHEITPFHMGEAAYVLGSSYLDFPAGSCHLILFDLFSSERPEIVMARHNGHFFIGPNNGIIPLTLRSGPIEAQLLAMVPSPENLYNWLQHTLPAISGLQQLQHNFAFYALTPPPEQFVLQIDGNKARCEILHIDQYENVVLNVTKNEFDRCNVNNNFSLKFMQVEEITAISSSYHKVRQGDKLCRFNSNGYLEICINRGKAASLFGLRLGSKLNNIEIFFE